MEKEMKAKVEEIIEAKAQEAIDMGWIDDTISLSSFVGWISEAMNLCGEDGVYDAWKEYDNHDALECYCRYLKAAGGIKDWDWNTAGYQGVLIKQVEN